MDTFRTDGTATGIAMRASERGRDASLVAMVLGDRVDARHIEIAETCKASRGGSIVMQVVQMDYCGGLLPDDEQADRLIKAANRRVNAGRTTFIYPGIEKPRKGYPFRVRVRLVHPGVAGADWITGSHHRTRGAADSAFAAYRAGKGYISGEVINDDC